MSVLDAITALKPGNHGALFYRTQAEQMAAVIPYIKTGLLRNERCLYIAEENSVAVILAELEKAGVDTRRAHISGALTVATKRETYLRHGIFEPDMMIAELRREVAASLKSGFSAFRATGEMTWALWLPSALVRLAEYELKLHEDFPLGFLGLCQYNENAFPPTVLRQMRHCHETMISVGQFLPNEPCVAAHAA